MTDQRVPLGISVITILMYIGAIVDIAAGVFMLIETGPVAEAADVSESVITGTGIAAIVFGIVIGLLAFGLRSASKGVRLIIAVVMVVRIAASVYTLVALPGARFDGLVTGIIALVVLYFLYGSEESKAFFDGTPRMT